MIVPSAPSWKDCSEPRAYPSCFGAPRVFMPPYWLSPVMSMVTVPGQLGYLPPAFGVNEVAGSGVFSEPSLLNVTATGARSGAGVGVAGTVTGGAGGVTENSQVSAGVASFLKL